MGWCGRILWGLLTEATSPWESPLPPQIISHKLVQITFITLITMLASRTGCRKLQSKTVILSLPRGISKSTRMLKGPNGSNSSKMWPRHPNPCQLQARKTHQHLSRGPAAAGRQGMGPSFLHYLTMFHTSKLFWPWLPRDSELPGTRFYPFLPGSVNHFRLIGPVLLLQAVSDYFLQQSVKQQKCNTTSLNLGQPVLKQFFSIVCGH